MAPQDPNIIADSVRSRLVTVERTCRSLTASVGPFKDPHQVRSVSGLLSPSCCQRTDLQHANHLAKIGSRIWLTI